MKAVTVAPETAGPVRLEDFREDFREDAWMVAPEGEPSRRVVAKTPAHDDQDHIHLIVESNPKIPSRVAHIADSGFHNRIVRNCER